jgi:multidrug efflux pump subunit AcrA (membrane-fusion protein)
MKHLNRWLVVILLILAALHLAACSQTQAADAPSKIEPAQVEQIEGTELNRLTLTEKAAQRLDIQMAPVREEQVDGAQRLVVPYSAVIYDLEGATWIYISPEPLTYLREPVTVDHIEGDMAVLVDGPATGTEVVTVGVAELYGTDTGIGK